VPFYFPKTLRKFLEFQVRYLSFVSHLGSILKAQTNRQGCVHDAKQANENYCRMAIPHGFIFGAQ
jgi:hypothetical protein